MSTKRNTNFTINAPKPIDSRMQVLNEAALSSIAIKYDRMKVYALAEDTEWRYFSEDLGTPWHKIADEGGGIASVAWEDITGDPVNSTSLVNYLGANYATKVHTHVTDDITPVGGFLTWQYSNVAPNFILTGSGGSTAGAVQRYTDLLDTDADYVGKALTVPEVKATQDGLAFVNYRDLISERIRWKGEWVNASYEKGDQVLSLPYLGIANTNTSDVFPPQIDGLPAWSLPFTPIWDVQTVLGDVATGADFTIPYLMGTEAYRFWVNLQLGIEYTIIAYELINGVFELIETQLFPAGSSQGWYTISALNSRIFQEGERFRVVVVNHDITNDVVTPTIYNWRLGLDSATTGNITVNSGIMYISTTDDDGTDRTALISSIKEDDTIKVNEEGSTDRTVFYVATGTSVAGTNEYIVPVVLISTGREVRDDRAVDAVFTINQATNTDYVRIVDGNVGNPFGVKGFVTQDVLDLTDINLTLDDNQYGVDLLIQKYSVSTNWDYIPIGVGAGTSTEGGSDIIIIDDLITQDTTSALSADMGYNLDQIKYSKTSFLGISVGAPSANQPVKTNSAGKLDISFIPAGGLPTTTVNFPVVIEFSMDKIDKGDIHSMHGALIALTAGEILDTGNPILVTSGVSKLLVVAKAGTVVDGNVIFSGTTVDKNTGVRTLGVSSPVPLTTLATDTTAPDNLGYDTINIVDALSSAEWFVGDVTISVNSAILTDVDIYQLAYEQFNDEPNLTINSIDIGFKLNNNAAQLTTQLYAVENIAGLTSFTPITTPIELLQPESYNDKFYRIRRGNIGKQLNGSTDGVVVSMNFDPLNQKYFEEVSVKVWASISKDVTIEAGIQTVTGDGVDNSVARNPVMDLSDWANTTTPETFTRELTVSNQDGNITNTQYSFNVINNTKSLLDIGYNYVSSNIDMYFGNERVKFRTDDRSIEFHPDGVAMLGIDGTSLTSTVTMAQIVASGNPALLTKEYGDANYLGLAVIDITWEDLVALGSLNRVALSLYNIVGSIDNTKDYGRVMLLNGNIFQHINSSNIVETITIV